MRLRNVIIMAILFAMLPVRSHGQPLRSNLSLLGKFDDFSRGAYEDIWGYSADGREYALLATSRGTFVIEVTDPGQPVERAFIEGAISRWRDIKTYKNFAYVTHDANSNSFPMPGIQIIDLSGLPNSASLAGTYSMDLSAGLAHNLYIDGKYAYIAGGRSEARGCVILDLEPNPAAPTEVGRWNDTYWHDVYAKNDTLFGSTLSGKGIQIVDARDKSSLAFISQTEYPRSFTHNIWGNASNTLIAQTDEVHDLPVNFWDIRNPKDLKLVGRYYGGIGSIAHNAHMLGELAIISYYYDGLKIIDLANPAAPTEIAFYDTYPDDNFRRGNSYDGAWGAYPFLPSDNIIVSDQTHGLFVLKHEGPRAGYITGKIRRDDVGTVLFDVSIKQELQLPHESFATPIMQDDGTYVYGNLPGDRTLIFQKEGFEDLRVDGVLFKEGETAQLNLRMRPVTLTTVDASLNLPASFKLLANAPNPFNPATQIQWQQPQNGGVQLELLTSTGRSLQNRNLGHYSAGKHRFQINMAGLPSGVYLYRLKIGNWRSPIGKMTLMR